MAAQMPGVRLLFMQSSGGSTEARRFQGKDAILSGPAGGIVGMARMRARGGTRASDRIRHGRHVDRRESLRGRVRTRVRHRSGGRARARSHDEHSHHRGGRRIHHPLRRVASARRPRIRGRRSGARMLSPRRPADGHRRERVARAYPAGALSASLRSRRATGARSRPGGAALRRARAAHERDCGLRHRPRGGRGRGLADRRRQHGERDQAHLGGTRLRRDALYLAVLRRSGWPARLPGGGCIGHRAHFLPSARRRAVGPRHGARRPDRDARGDARERPRPRRRGRGAAACRAPRAGSERGARGPRRARGTPAPQSPAHGALSRHRYRVIVRAARPR